MPACQRRKIFPKALPAPLISVGAVPNPAPPECVRPQAQSTESAGQADLCGAQTEPEALVERRRSYSDDVGLPVIHHLGSTGVGVGQKWVPNRPKMEPWVISNGAKDQNLRIPWWSNSDPQPYGQTHAAGDDQTRKTHQIASMGTAPRLQNRHTTAHQPTNQPARLNPLPEGGSAGSLSPFLSGLSSKDT